MANRILVIEEDDALGKAVRRALEWIDAPEEVISMRPGPDVAEIARAERFATILLGATGDALALLGTLTSEALGQAPVFVVADPTSEALTAQVLEQGAVDCIARSRFMVGGLPKVVLMALEQSRLQQSVAQSSESPDLDPSTQLGSGNLLIRDLARAIAAAERAQRSFCLMFVELERVKSPRATAVGWPPEIAPEFARRLRKTARGTDLFFQLAPRRFAALLDGMDASNNMAFARRVRSSVLLPFRIGAGVLDLDAWIGVTSYPEDGKTPEALLRAAEQALKNAMQSREGIATAAAQRLVRRGT